MYLENVSKLNKDSLLSEKLLEELFGLDDAYLMEQYRQALVEKAAELKCKTEFNKLYSAYKKELKKQNLQFSDKPSYLTDFEGQPALRCGSWVANEDGVWMLSDRGRIIACSHPIYISRVLINAETGIHKAEIKFKVRRRWHSAFIDR